MFINLHRTVEKLGENLPQDGRIDFGSAPKRIVGEVSAAQTDSVVCLTIPEPLPGLKEVKLSLYQTHLSIHNPAVKKYPLSFYRKWVRSGISRPLYCIHESFL